MLPRCPGLRGARSKPNGFARFDLLGPDARGHCGGAGNRGSCTRGSIRCARHERNCRADRFPRGQP